MKIIVANNLTNEITEIEEETHNAKISSEDLTPQKTDSERISDLETLVLELGGII